MGVCRLVMGLYGLRLGWGHDSGFEMTVAGFRRRAVDMTMEGKGRWVGWTEIDGNHANQSSILGFHTVSGFSTPR